MSVAPPRRASAWSSAACGASTRARVRRRLRAFKGKSAAAIRREQDAAVARWQQKQARHV